MNISVTKRGPMTKGERKKRLRQGYVPGAVYGKELEPFLIEVPARGIADVLLSPSGQNTVIDMAVSGDTAKHPVILGELQRDPLTRNFVHAGFHQVKKGDKVTAQVPIQLVGEPEAVALHGALLEQMLDTLEVRAQPADLPPHLDVDVSKMQIGDVLRVSDLPHNAKLDFSTGEEIAIAAVHVSHVAEVVAETMAEAPPDTSTDKKYGEDTTGSVDADTEL